MISRNREDVLNCRIENTFNEAFDYRFRLYQKIAQKPEVIKIDNTGSIEKSVSLVIESIRTKEKL